jgi:heptosyltransferase-1
VPGPAAALPSTAERLLVVRLSHLGDVVCGLPAWHALRGARPGARLGWVVQAEFAPLLEVLPGLELVRFDRSGGLGAWRTLRRDLRAFAPDATLDVQGNAKSAAAAWLSGALRRYGPRKEEWQEPWAARATPLLAAAAAGPHPVQRAVAVAEAALGRPVEARTDLPLPPELRARGALLLDQLLPDRGRPRRLVHPGREGDPRTLPARALAEVLRQLRAEEDLLVVTGPAEAEVGAGLAESLPAGPGLGHLVGQRGLPELAGLLHAAGEAGLRLLAGDSGPTHLAASVGVGTDTWFGPTDPLKTGPWPPMGCADSGHRAHRAPGGDLTRLDPAALARALRAGVALDT